MARKSSPEYKYDNDEVIQKGSQPELAERIGNELADYAAESACRMGAASEYLTFFDPPSDESFVVTSKPDPKLLKLVRKDHAIATAEFEATTKASEILLQTDATKPANTSRIQGLVDRLGHIQGLLEQGPPQ